MNGTFEDCFEACLKALKELKEMLLLDSFMSHMFPYILGALVNLVLFVVLYVVVLEFIIHRYLLCSGKSKRCKNVLCKNYCICQCKRIKEFSGDGKWKKEKS